MAAPEKTSNELAEERTDLAAKRTVMAADGTLMAWIRTSLFLTGMGTLSIVIGTIEYWAALQDLKGEYEVRIWRPAFIMALLMSLLGLFLFMQKIFAGLLGL